MSSIERDLYLLLRGTEDVRLRKNKLEVELRGLERAKEEMERELADLRMKLRDAGGFIENVTQGKDALLREIEEIDRRLDQMKVNKIAAPFVACLVAIVVMVILYFLL